MIEQKNVSEQGLVSQSSPAYTVSNKSTLMVTFYVPADAVDQMAAGDKVTIENGRRTYEGTIAEVGTMVDPATGLFKVKASADEDDGAPSDRAFGQGHRRHRQGARQPAHPAERRLL